MKDTLTVKELIKLLEQLDQDLPVYYMNDEFNCPMQLTSAPVVKCDLTKWASNINQGKTKVVLLGYDE